MLQSIAWLCAKDAESAKERDAYYRYLRARASAGCQRCYLVSQELLAGHILRTEQRAESSDAESDSSEPPQNGAESREQ